MNYTFIQLLTCAPFSVSRLKSPPKQDEIPALGGVYTATCGYKITVVPNCSVNVVDNINKITLNARSKLTF